jgi:hypothetical protein
MAQRAKIFEPTTLDVSDFTPRTETEPRPDADQIDQVSGPKFRSREMASQPLVDHRTTDGQPPTRRQPMVYRTGRNVTFSAKTTQATVDTFYEIARQQGWKAGETFEKAIEALKRQLAGS